MNATLCAHTVLMAQYNAWMNAKLYDAAATLSSEALAADRGAFFGSVLGTLNHLVVGDTIWLKRFAVHPAQPQALQVVRDLPAPTALNQLLFADFAALRERRQLLDATIQSWASSLTADDLSHTLSYANTKGEAKAKNMGCLVMHFFNHQTHHRGQATTLLMQAGVDVGETDLLAMIPNS